MDDDHWLKRTEAARVLGCSYALVVWFEKHGRLKARVDDRQTRLYARSEVVALARVRAARGTPTRRGDRDVLRETVNGELASQIFSLFAISATLEQIVIKTKCAPEKVRALYQEWQTPIDLPSPAEVERARDRIVASLEPFRRAGGAKLRDEDDPGNVSPFRRKAAR